MSWYDRFVPCGIADAGVTSLSLELGRPVTVPEAANAVAPHLTDLLQWDEFTPSPDLETTQLVPTLGVSASR